MRRLCLLAAVVLPLAACVTTSTTPPPEELKRLADQLSEREGQPVEIFRPARERRGGREVICGYFGPPAQPDRPRQLHAFGAVDGQLATEEYWIAGAVMRGCFKRNFPQSPAPEG